MKKYLFYSVLGLVFVRGAQATSQECTYPSGSVHLIGPMNGELKQVFTIKPDPRAASPYPYDQVYICARPDSSRYVIIRDASHVRTPPQEVLKYYTEGYWTHYEVNTARLDVEPARSSLHLVTEGPTVHFPSGTKPNLWVFYQSPYVIGNMPIIQAVLEETLRNP